MFLIDHDFMYFQVKIWFQNRRSKYKKIMKQSPGSTHSQMSGGNPGSETPLPDQGSSPPPSHGAEMTPTSQHGQVPPHQQQQQQQHMSNNNNLPNGHHHPMMPPQASSVSPQPEMKWSDMNNMNTSAASNAYMPGMSMSGMAPHHYAWYSHPHPHQQSLLT